MRLLNNVTKEHLLELIFLFLITGLFLWNGAAILFDQKITHDFPWGYLATDAFQHQTRIQWIKDVGSYYYEPPYLSAGLKDVIGTYPPLIHHASIALSYASGLEVYDASYFLVFVFGIFSLLTVYLILKEFHPFVALLGIPLVLFTFFVKGSWDGYYFGHWPSLIGNFFFIVCCWSLSKIDLKKSYLLIALFLSGSAFGHTSSTIFTGLFIIVFFAIKFALKRLQLSQVKTFFIALIIFLAFSSYYLLLFQQSWLQTQPYKFYILTEGEWSLGGGIFTLTDFKAMFPLVLLGAVLSLVIITKENNFAPLFSLFSLFAGLTNYVGFRNRAFNFRFHWPITLAFLSGFSIFWLLKFVNKNWKYVLVLAFSTILTISLVYAYAPQKTSTPGLLDENTWKALMWLKDNTSENSQVYFWYGDGYDQAAFLGNSKRSVTLVRPEAFADALRNNTIKRKYLSQFYTEYGAGGLRRNGLFNVSLLQKDKYYSDLASYHEVDICNYDYHVFTKSSKYVPVLGVYNLIIANDLLKNSWIKQVYDNPNIIILKNENNGVDCIVERRIQ